MENGAGGHARAAVDDELVCVEQVLRQRRLVLEEAVAGARDPARDRIDRLDLAAPALRRASVDEREGGVAEPLEQLRRAGDVIRSRACHELGRLDLLGIRAQRAVPGVEPDHGGVVVPEVAQQPPEARCPARVLVVGDDEGLRADAGERGPGSECVCGRKRMPAAAVGAGEIGLRVGVRGSGHVTGEIRVPRAAIDEPVVHGASLARA